jgi:hemerythrin
MAIHWTSALSVGVPDIDGQHAELFRRVDRLHDAMLARDRAEAVRLLEYLHEYVRVHFALEDALMRDLGYPDHAAHTAEHASFAREVAALERDLAEHGATAALVLRLEREVSGWLQRHVYSTDGALGWWVREHRGVEVRS